MQLEILQRFMHVIYFTLLAISLRWMACVMHYWQCGGTNDPTYTTHRSNAGVMLGERRRRWHNIKSTLGQGFVFARKGQN